MSTLLQKNLYIKCSEENLEPLRSQWDFDKKLIPKALQNVGQLFPHFSRHDHSHSTQILVNIERILGDRVFLLSATDTWLLLEAAYWHDIGMVVPRKSFEEAIHSESFQEFRLELANDESNELRSFAEKFVGSDTSVVFSGAESPLDAIDKFRQLMAEWFRRHHPIRSENAVNDPWGELGISSPRTELIPKRFFSILGRICALHGAAYEEVIAQLPYKEAGLGNDDCHPRYIACLLRLGDLLDMDDNRFCPVMQRIAGDNVPSLTKAHIDKHESIKHFRLDSERIEVHAVCKTIDGYAAQWKWLDWLKSELQKQMSQWLDIVPSKAFGLLPTLGDVQVDISRKQLVAKPGERPEFRLNAPQIMHLLKGENLYKENDIIRELLQNAVDATLIKIWIESKANGENPITSPDDIRNNFSPENSINVYIERISGDDNESEFIDWKLTIQDSGIGISQNDLTLLMNIGSSNRGSKRISIINDMPEWMQPSGTFGIGFQSVFMWTDEVEIWTKSILTGESLHVTLNSPTGPRKGLVTIELDDDDFLKPCGTKIIFKFKSHKKYLGISRSLGQDDLVTSAYENYDPLLDDEIPLQTINLIQSIDNFNQYSLIEIVRTYKEDNYTKPAISTPSADEGDKMTFIPQTNCYFRARLSPKSHHAGNNEIFYRGQHVEKSKSRTMNYFCFDIDILSGKAGKWLNFNRNSIRDNSESDLTDLINKNFRYWVEANKEKLLRDNSEIISIISKYKIELECRNNNDDVNFWKSIYEESKEQWLNLTCDISVSGTKKSETYSNVLKMDSFIVGELDSEFELPYTDVALCSLYEIESYLIMKEWCKNLNHGVRYIVGKNNIGNGEKHPRIYSQLLTINPDEKRIQIDQQSLAVAINRKSKDLQKIGRLIMPISLFPEKLSISKLELKDGISGWFSNVINYIPDPEPHVVLPFEIKNGLWSFRKLTIGLDRYDEFLLWIHARLKNEIDMRELRIIYDRLIRYIDEDIMGNTESWKTARKKEDIH